MRTIAILIICLMATSCAIVGTGRFPVPSATPGIEIRESKYDIQGTVLATESHVLEVAIELADYLMIVQRPHGYSLNVGAVGILVPVIPLWTSPDHVRLAIALKFHPKTTKGTFKPGLLRVVVGEKEYVPSEITMEKDHRCGSSPLPKASTVEPTSSINIARPLCIWFRFDQLMPPDEDFSLIVADGLPVVKYTMKRRTEGGIFLPSGG